MKIEEIRDAVPEVEQEDLIDKYIKVIGSKLQKKGTLKQVWVSMDLLIIINVFECEPLVKRLKFSRFQSNLAKLRYRYHFLFRSYWLLLCQFLLTSKNVVLIIITWSIFSLSPVKTRGYRVELVRLSVRPSVCLSRLMWGTLSTRVWYEGVELELSNFVHAWTKVWTRASSRFYLDRLKIVDSTAL